MPSATDFYNEMKATHTAIDGVNSRLDGVNSRLDGANSRLDALKAAVDHVDKTLMWGLGQLVTLGIYTNQALSQNAKQNDTMICILEQISRNTCALLNESHEQTGLQTAIRESATILADLYAATHAEAALAREKLIELRKQIEECCPPKPPEPPCSYRPCPKPPERLGEPPRVDERPPRSIEGGD